MSRNIAPKFSVSLTQEEMEACKTDKNRLLITSCQGRSCALLLQNDRLMEASFFSKDPGKVGAVYIGRIRNVAKNIDACFVEIAKGEICFLPLKNAACPCLLNRNYDGRILEGDELLVQVVRDAQKGKRASVTAHLSLSNDYFVLTMGERKTGYSTRLSKAKKNAVRRLFREKALFAQEEDVLAPGCGALLPEEDSPIINIPPTGLIVRTRAEESGCGEEELLDHFYTLLREYIRLLTTAPHRSCFSCLKEADSKIETILSRFPLREVQEIITDQEDFYRQLTQTMCVPSENQYHPPRNSAAGEIPQYPEIHLYQNKSLPLSTLYSLKKKLETALADRVWLKSGAYLVIEPTEALTVIDVNSGKYESGKQDSHDTYLRINLEAAEEVARQLRLRNLSGIIIVDFINMQLPEDNRQLLSCLKLLTAKDKVPTTVVDMTALGLVEITRKKINRPLQEQYNDCVT